MQRLSQDNSGSHKVVLLGDSRVGKTSIIARKLQGFQPQAANPTIGCHCSEIAVDINDRKVLLQVWDTAGQEMYRALVPVYLRNARAALLVYDVADRESFISLGHWYDTLMEVVPTTTATFLVGNKIDLEAHVIDDGQAKQFAAAHNAEFVKVSAATGAGLDDLFLAIGKSVITGAALQLTGQQPVIEEAPQESGCQC
jgi:small GTP-binding protein